MVRDLIGPKYPALCRSCSLFRPNEKAGACHHPLVAVGVVTDAFRAANQRCTRMSVLADDAATTQQFVSQAFRVVVNRFGASSGRFDFPHQFDPRWIMGCSGHVALR